MGMRNQQKLFSEFLRLVGTEVVVGVISSGEKLGGKIVNAMFDSFILDAPSGRHVIAYRDVKFLDEV